MKQKQKHETEYEIWADLGLVGNTEKKIGPIMSNFWGRFFHVLMGKKIFFENTVASALKNSIICTSFIKTFFEFLGDKKWAKYSPGDTSLWDFFVMTLKALHIQQVIARSASFDQLGLKNIFYDVQFNWFDLFINIMPKLILV